MNTKSAKAKSRRLQNLLAEELRRAFPELEEDDIMPALMGDSGNDIKLSPAARKIIPYGFECKNQEKLNIWQAMKQAVSNAADLRPAVVYKRNRTDAWVSVPLETFVDLIKEKHENSQ